MTRLARALMFLSTAQDSLSWALSMEGAPERDAWIASARGAIEAALTMIEPEEKP